MGCTPKNKRNRMRLFKISHLFTTYVSGFLAFAFMAGNPHLPQSLAAPSMIVFAICAILGLGIYEYEDYIYYSEVMRN